MHSLVKVLTAFAVCGLVWFGYHQWQLSKAWIITYEVTAGKMVIEATSDGAKKHVYVGPVSMREIRGTWNTANPPPEEIELLFSDYTLRPGRIVFSLGGQRFDLMERSLAHVESETTTAR